MIIKPNKTFEGGQLSQRTTTYLKPNTKVIEFYGKEKGVFLFLLGAYKQDVAGNGVWYRPLKIRDNFGMGQFKEKIAVQPNCPIEYFSNKVQTFAREMAQPREEEMGDGSNRKRKIYPAWGRIQWRVLYNSALYDDLKAGPHILDLPQNGGASVLDTYLRGTTARGEENPMLNNYEAAIPLNIQLDLKVAGQPWKITIDNSSAYRLPDELADSANLYNLDEVINYLPKEELIEKLKSIVPSDIFNRGMEGYSITGKTTVSMAVPNAHEDDDNIPMTFPQSSSTTAANPVPVSAPKTASIAPKVNMPKSASTTDDLPKAPVFNSPSNADVIGMAKASLAQPRSPRTVA